MLQSMAAEITQLKMDLSERDAELSLLQKTSSNSQESGIDMVATCPFVLQQSASLRLWQVVNQKCRYLMIAFVAEIEIQYLLFCHYLSHVPWCFRCAQVFMANQKKYSGKGKTL